MPGPNAEFQLPYTQFLEKLASEHPDHASVVKLGKSVFGKEITGLRMGDQSKPEILIMIQGAHHAVSLNPHLTLVWQAHNMPVNGSHLVPSLT